MSTTTSPATPCFRFVISEIIIQPGIHHNEQVNNDMDPLLAYSLAPMHLSAFYIHRSSGRTTWEPASSSNSTATPRFHAEISGFEPLGTPQKAAWFLAHLKMSRYMVPWIHCRPTMHLPCSHASFMYLGIGAVE